MQIVQGQEDGFNRKCFIMIRSINSTDSALIKALADVHKLERDFVGRILNWKVAYLFFAKWHKN
jgi:hypothetical protein